MTALSRPAYRAASRLRTSYPRVAGFSASRSPCTMKSLIASLKNPGWSRAVEPACIGLVVAEKQLGSAIDRSRMCGRRIGVRRPDPSASPRTKQRARASGVHDQILREPECGSR